MKTVRGILENMNKLEKIWHYYDMKLNMGLHLATQHFTPEFTPERKFCTRSPKGTHTND
jgi:hypothetical protein